MHVAGGAGAGAGGAKAKGLIAQAAPPPAEPMATPPPAEPKATPPAVGRARDRAEERGEREVEERGRGEGEKGGEGEVGKRESGRERESFWKKKKAEAGSAGGDPWTFGGSNPSGRSHVAPSP